ncbi:hypothetical protein L6E12_25950 [Actinokineospora sp. PR83]|uniref:hypothetical protein n=1 Tax=Actinokineospora sp. PR83 TaxID=2884908 RepID=UPI001F1B9B89|nr:hypothetical protein [Actinokineospora sp. PR83]MCG8919229.1 hypothetical protein [Actinokineospora sp. PR83]
MLSLRRMFVAGAIAVPLALGGAGTALADDYQAQESVAGPWGASTTQVAASTDNDHFGHHHHHGYRHDDDDNGSAFVGTHSAAGPEGAVSEYVIAVADEDGDVAYFRGEDVAGNGGASSTRISATAGN